MFFVSHPTHTKINIYLVSNDTIGEKMGIVEIKDNEKIKADRILGHAIEHLNLFKQAYMEGDLNTADFLIQIVITDLTNIAQFVRQQLEYKKKGGLVGFPGKQ